MRRELASFLPSVADRALPSIPAALDGVLSEVVGTFTYLASPGARSAVRANLAVLAPERRRREALVRRTFVEQVRNYLEIFRIPRLRPERLLASVREEGWDQFVRAFARGRGVVIASAHVGPISVVGQIMVAKGYPVTLPVERDSGGLSRSVNRARTRMGLRFVSTDSAIGIHRVLRRGEILAVLADRAVTGVGERVAFFGRPALLPSVHVALAMRTGAALVPAFAGREGGTMVARFHPAMELVATGDRAADLRENMRRWAAVLEGAVSRAPEQWSVFERVWTE
ncbi:MAG: lysophospholipid acyltransferase family protein [Chloroflexota bacterium]|nr:lysophospholipid acyltransferase family protein [Chloroflexota bacterium]